MSRTGKRPPLLTKLPIDERRFDEILDNLYAGLRINKKAREEIAQLLEFLSIVLYRNREHTRPGASPELDGWQKAEIVRILQKRHGCSQAKAVHAVIPNGTLKMAESLGRAVRRLNRSGGAIAGKVLAVNPKVLAEAEKRLAGQK
jgi:hypothetical protein